MGCGASKRYAGGDSDGQLRVGYNPCTDGWRGICQPVTAARTIEGVAVHIGGSVDAIRTVDNFHRVETRWASSCDALMSNCLPKQKNPLYSGFFNASGAGHISVCSTVDFVLELKPNDASLVTVGTQVSVLSTLQ